MIALYPGTFDPLSLGHEDVIIRASKLFDHLIVGVSNDNSKNNKYSLEERLHMLSLISKKLPNVTCESYSGLTVDFANANNIDVIIRGARNSTDFNYESQIAQMNNTMDNALESIFFIASDPYKSITSSLVREVISLNGDYSKFVSQEVANFLNKIKVKSL